MSSIPLAAFGVLATSDRGMLPVPSWWCAAVALPALSLGTTVSVTCPPWVIVQWCSSRRPRGFLPLGIVLSARTPFPWLQAASWVGEHTEPGDRVASFNSGSLGYLSPRTVVNLDGVVNNPGMRALEEHRLLEFLRQWDIRYILDDPDYVAKYMEAYGGGDWRQVVMPVDPRVRTRVYEAASSWGDAPSPRRESGAID
jgi:hypothetical protein